MRFASLVAISYFVLGPGYAASSLSGAWALNRAKSDFGMATAPEQIAVRLEQTGSRLAIWTITTDVEGQHLSYQKYSLNRKSEPLNGVMHFTRGRIVLQINSAQGTQTDEEWRVTKSGELIIIRVVTPSFETMHERLVLEPSTRVLE